MNLLHIRDLRISAFPMQVIFLVVFVSLCIGLKTKTEQYSKNVSAKLASLPELEAGYQANSLKLLSLGYEHFVANILWIKLLQKARHDPITSQSVSWEFAQLNAVTTLDPKFEQAYFFGATFLSILRRDILGAKLILEKWVMRRPNYWKAHYALAYHLYQEMGDYKNASKHMLVAASLEGSPPWLSALGVRLLSETGALLQSIDVAISLFTKVQSREGRVRLIGRIRSLNFALQEHNWNQALGEYQKRNKRPPVAASQLIPFLQTFNREVASFISERDIPKDVRRLLNEAFEFRLDRTENKLISVKTLQQLGLETVGIARPKQSVTP